MIARTLWVGSICINVYICRNEPQEVFLKFIYRRQPSTRSINVLSMLHTKRWLETHSIGADTEFREGGSGNCYLLKCIAFACTRATFFHFMNFGGPVWGS